jgi:predicted outer membrane repeat protein
MRRISAGLWVIQTLLEGDQTMRRASTLPLICVLILCAPLTGQTVLYVDDDAPPGSNGQSWATALADLQDALDVASIQVDDVEIRVAGGIYKPSQETEVGEPRTATFTLLNETAIRGGYRGLAGGGDPDDRDPGVFVSVLSGDIGIEGDVADNCFHVLYGGFLNASAILDGMTITGGNADSGPGRDRGAGIYMSVNQMTIVGCSFTANKGGYGGGVYMSASSPTLLDCAFRGNSVTGSGGGIYCTFDSTPTLKNCMFVENAAGDFAGSSGAGGGMYIAGDSDAQLIDCVFQDNTAGDGGGLAVTSGSAPILLNCHFRRNHAIAQGGAISNEYEVGILLTNCVLIGNSAGTGIGSESRGGAIYNNSSFPILTNCTVVGNTADYGGALYSFCTTHPPQPNPSLVNCIVWGNSSWLGPQIPIYEDRCATSITYSCVEGGWTGLGNIDDDPSFIDAAGTDGEYGTPDDNPRLTTLISPCIDTGADEEVPADLFDLDSDGDLAEPTPYDLDGLRRFVDGDSDAQARVDMGAFEATSPDCNDNGIPDAVDIAAGTSTDCDTNGVPDECDLDPADPNGDSQVAPDCNSNDVPDGCDIAAGTSLDLDPPDGVPDECQVAQPITGACCVSDTCIVATGKSCLAAGGAYQGDEAKCDGADCFTLDPADLDRDGDVDLDDYALFIANYTGPR